MPFEALAKKGHPKHVYLLEGPGIPNSRYVGMTSDLKRRLAERRAGLVVAPPWQRLSILFDRIGSRSVAVSLASIMIRRRDSGAKARHFPISR